MLEIINARKTFLKGTPNAHTALDGLTLTVPDGQFVTVIGSNGAGKSTLFGAISGAFLLDEGRVRLDGSDITCQPEHRRALTIGRLFQDPMKGTAPDMTIEENLALAYHRRHGGPLRRGVSKKDAPVFRDALARLGMGLEDRMNMKVGQLSGGQRQALSLLMSTIGKPRLLLLDEHTAALDPAAAAQILALTRQIVARDGLTALMVTHNIRSALETGTRMLMLDAGKIVLDVSGEEKAGMTVPDLLARFSGSGGPGLDNDRMLLG